jgi:hypothetical protein
MWEKLADARSTGDAGAEVAPPVAASSSVPPPLSLLRLPKWCRMRVTQLLLVARGMPPLSALPDSAMLPGAAVVAMVSEGGRGRPSYVTVATPCEVTERGEDEALAPQLGRGACCTLTVAVAAPLLRDVGTPLLATESVLIWPPGRGGGACGEACWVGRCSATTSENTLGLDTAFDHLI